MVKDDVDMHSKGNFDRYWICNECDTGCIEKVRYNEVSDIIWQEE
jgi:hypothetical protein